MSAANSVISNDTSITLDWADVTGANLYQLEVGLLPDFSGTLLVNDATLVASTKAFTDAGASGYKRYWRWRSSANGGTTWTEWSTVGSYWLDTTLSADVTLAVGTWQLINPSDLTDAYLLPDYPVYDVQDQNLYRGKGRNRAGELLTEWLTSKAVVVLHFDQGLYATHEHMRAWKRFHAQVKTFFLAGYVSDGVNYVPMIWKGILAEDPAFSMLAAGREDFFVGTITFEEA